MADENLDLAWGYKLEDYINIGTSASPNWVLASELLTWNINSENTEYSPSWLDRKNQPKFIMGSSCTVDFEKDTVVGGELEAWVIEHRNDTDVPCEICRVYTWMGTATAKTADKAGFLFTPNAFSKSNAGQPVVSGGVFNRSSDGWEAGNWNPTTKAFTAGGGTEG